MNEKRLNNNIYFVCVLWFKIKNIIIKNFTIKTLISCYFLSILLLKLTLKFQILSRFHLQQWLYLLKSSLNSSCTYSHFASIFQPKSYKTSKFSSFPFYPSTKAKLSNYSSPCHLLRSIKSMSQQLVEMKWVLLRLQCQYPCTDPQWSDFLSPLSQRTLSWFPHWAIWASQRMKRSTLSTCLFHLRIMSKVFTLMTCHKVQRTLWLCFI